MKITELQPTTTGDFYLIPKQTTFTCPFCDTPTEHPVFACRNCLDVLRAIVARNKPIYQDKCKPEIEDTRPDRNAVIEAICDAFDITWDQLFGSNWRGRELVDARHLFGYIMSTVYGMEHRDIAKMIHRDQSNVSHGKKRVIALMRTNREYRDKTRRVFALIEKK